MGLDESTIQQFVKQFQWEKIKKQIDLASKREDQREGNSSLQIPKFTWRWLGEHWISWSLYESWVQLNIGRTFMFNWTLGEHLPVMF